MSGVEQADPSRITTMLDTIAGISETSGTDGITRLAFTPYEREAHQLVGGWLCELGLGVRTDAIGNTIAELPGEPGYPAIGTGSHLDSVPHGGRFDGIAGVVAAVELARLVTASRVRHRHPLRFVIFGAEEGARFGQACIGSKAVAGLWTDAELSRIRDANGVSIGEAMRSVGLDATRVADAAWSRGDWAAFLELHVEQGQVLESVGMPIAIVDLISGSTRFELVLTGQASHTGSTPMGPLRADALTAAATIVLIAEEIASDPQHRGTRCTVGRLRVHPDSITTIPGEVTMSVDVRDVDSDRQRETANEIVRRARTACDRRGVGLSVRLLSDASPVVMPARVRDVVASVCSEASIPYRTMYSGASHDAQIVNRIVPAGLIFVPSKSGLSHVPAEWTSSSDIAFGVDVLVRSVLALDAELARHTPELPREGLANHES